MVVSLSSRLMLSREMTFADDPTKVIKFLAPCREELEQLIAKWRSDVNPGCRYCAMQLEALLDKNDEEEKSND